MEEMRDRQFFEAEYAPKIITKVRERLFDLDNPKSQKLLKVIKYDDRNPLSNDDLSIVDFINLADPDSEDRRIFTINQNGEVQGEARTEFRIWAGSIRVIGSNNLYSFKMGIYMQVITHEKIREIKLNDNEAIPTHNRELTIYSLVNDLLLGYKSGGYGLLITDPSLAFTYSGGINNNTRWVGAHFGLVAHSG